MFNLITKNHWFIQELTLGIYMFLIIGYFIIERGEEIQIDFTVMATHF